MLLALELLLIYKLWLSTRSFERELAALPPATPQPTRLAPIM